MIPNPLTRIGSGESLGDRVSVHHSKSEPHYKHKQEPQDVA